MISHSCAHAVRAAAFSSFGLLATISAADAHVTLATAVTPPNAYYKAVLQVPHGCDGAATTTIRVRIPEGVIGVKPMPKSGWTLTTTRAPYAKSYENHGRPVTEGVQEIAWSGGNLSDDHFDEFVFSGFVATDGGAAGAVYFPVVQTCATGETAWSEIPSAGQSAHSLKAPAPQLRIAGKPVTVAQAGGHQDHAATSGADTFKAGAITVAAPWTRATPGGAKVAGGYLKLTNAGTTADRLIAGVSDIAGRLELHEMAMNNGVMQMRPLNAGIEIKPGETVELKPGGLHVMFMDLKRQLKQGETAKATLEFEKAGKVEVMFRVDSVGATSAPHKHH